ncbi:MAG TPA: hypothetical protein VNP04_12815 [Alphaproteobacteria bacterium]|nr:hypothetical protein [Alphaproteobacteria bacterium]
MPIPKPSDNERIIFHAEGLTKIYRMGEVEVHALGTCEARLSPSPSSWRLAS